MNQNPSNLNQNNFSSKPPKKINLGLIIGIIAVVSVAVVAIVFGSKLLSNGGNNNSSENENVNNQENKKNDWIPYDSIKHYTIEELKPINLKDITIEKPILKIGTKDHSIVMDFTNSDYFPSYIDSDGIEGGRYVIIKSSISEKVIGNKTNEYNSLLAEGDYNNGCQGEDGKEAYYTCHFVINNIEVAIGVNVDSTPISEAKQIIRDRLQQIQHDNPNAIVLEEFHQNNIQKVKFNLSKINLEGKVIEAYPTYDGYKGNITLTGITSVFYGSPYAYAKYGDLKLQISSKHIEPSSEYEVLEINDYLRLYRTKKFCNYYSNNEKNMHFSYILGVVEDDKEYFLPFSYRESYSGTENKNTLCQSETYIKEIENKIIDIIKNNF